MPLAKEHTDFSLRDISTIDAKKVQIDRVLTNLLIFLKYPEYIVTSRKRKLITINDLTDAICKEDILHFDGFSDKRSIVYKWLESDFLSLVHRGDPIKQQVAAPLPLHLNVYKLRNPKFNADYGVSNQIFSLLYYGAPKVMKDLHDFLSKGADYYSDAYDGQTNLDIETLLMIRIIDQMAGHSTDDYADERKKRDIPEPICIGQARTMGEDISHILAYENKIPRVVLMDYIKNILAFHTGLYVLRLFQIVPDLVASGQRHPNCVDCMNKRGFNLNENCAFRPQIVADMGESYQTRMAELARRQYNLHIEQLNTYVKAHLTLKKLQEFSIELVRDRHIAKPQSLEEILSLRSFHDPFEIKSFFKTRIRSLLEGDLDTVDHRLLAIQNMGLSEFETYIEMLFLLRQPFHQKYFVQLLDSLLQKNSENGLLRQGYGKRNSRRYAIASGLLETLVQIAVLEQNGNNGYRTRSIRVDDFIEWLQNRYGIHIGNLPGDSESSITDLEALRINVQNFKARLREIGFYTDLSDAYISQVIRPRYYIEQGA
jgi:hypothetical protein